MAEIVEQWAVERPDLDASPLLVLGRVSWVANAMEAELRPPFAAAGLGNGDFDVLAALRRAGRPYTLRHRELTAAMLVTPGAVTKRVDRLVEKGYVARAAADEDGRGQLVRLTRAGVRFVDRMIEVHLANEARMLGGLSERERAQLARLLGKLVAQLEG
ncbi:MAG TPA: MarR family transcriptional regulator [Actinophytocola sp.]|nr:MarR family transcriptional regulator [Actinophytocola sp.]